MYVDLDDDDVLEAYLPGATPKPLPVRGLVDERRSSRSSTLSPGGRDLRKSSATKSDVCEVSASPKVFSPAGYSPAIKSQSRSYGARTRSKDVFFRYNCKAETDWHAPKPNEWNLIVNPFGVEIYKPGFKYMFQRTAEISGAVDDHVDILGGKVLDYYQLDKDQNLKESSAEDVNYIGQIRGDGKLTAGSTFFEGTKFQSEGHIVSLDLSALEEYFLFPGQVVALSGRNNLGKCVIVSKMFSPRSLPFPDKPIQIDSATGPLRILLAAGPYTTTDSLVFDPLSDFLAEVEKLRPHFVIMIGPFIDASHPMIEGGQVSDTFGEMFNKQMAFLSERVGEIDESCKIIVVGTFRDVHHHPVFPTPAFALKGLKNIIAVPDPAMIAIGGIVIGMTSVDILKHLAGSELSYSTINSDRMGRIARHLLSQRSFYPLYPADESVPMDLVNFAENGMMGSTPHILILPSDLRHFIKDVDGTVVVNPERLIKGVSGGHFAKLQISLTNEENLDFRGPVADFLMGEIIKI